MVISPLLIRPFKSTLSDLIFKTQAHLITKGKSLAQAETITNDLSQVILSQDGIDVWNVSGVTKPTDSELAAADTEGTKLQNNQRRIPTIVFEDDSFLVEPSDVELELKLKQLNYI